MLSISDPDSCKNVNFRKYVIKLGIFIISFIKYIVGHDLVNFVYLEIR